MNRFLAFCLSLFFVNQAYSQISIEKSSVKEVKVFFSGAEITRSFSVNLPQGKTEISIKNLSSLIEPNSLVASSSQSRIISIYQQNNSETVNNNAAIKNIQDSLEKQENILRYKSMKEEALEEEKKTLLQNAVRVGTAQGLSVEAMDQTAGYLRKKQEEINTLLLRNELEIVAIQTQINGMKKRIEGIKSELKERAGEVILMVESSTAQSADFQFSYYVSSCGWAPFYNVYSRGSSAPIQFDYKAKIMNKSGEDWNKVSLKLLASNPSRSLTMPSMETWVLSYQQRRRSGKVYGYNESGSEGNLSGKQIKNGQEIKDVNGVQELEVEEGEMKFEIEGEHSIPSGDKVYLADVKRESLNASYLYQAIPKLDAKAYLVAKIKDWEKLMLIEGEANVFMNETFVGKTYLDPFAAGDTLAISLGPDPSIQITRVKKKDFSTRRLIGLQLVENFSYEIDVRNLNKKPVFIEIFDQIPIAQQEEITINLEESSDAMFQPGNGKLTWKLEIPPVQTAKLKMGYSVKFPRDKIVIIKRTGKVICPKFR